MMIEVVLLYSLKPNNRTVTQILAIVTRQSLQRQSYNTITGTSMSHPQHQSLLVSHTHGIHVMPQISQSKALQCLSKMVLLLTTPMCQSLSLPSSSISDLSLLSVPTFSFLPLQCHPFFYQLLQPLPPLLLLISRLWVVEAISSILQDSSQGDDGILEILSD